MLQEKAKTVEKISFGGGSEKSNPATSNERTERSHQASLEKDKGPRVSIETILSSARKQGANSPKDLQMIGKQKTKKAFRSGGRNNELGTSTFSRPCRTHLEGIVDRLLLLVVLIILLLRNQVSKEVFESHCCC